MNHQLPSWTQSQRIGFSVKSMDQMRVALDAGSNVIELKLEKFELAGTPLLNYDGCEFLLNHVILGNIAKMCQGRDCTVNLHDYLERCVDPSLTNGINVGFPAHNAAALKKHLAFVHILRLYGIGETVTMHPPTVTRNGERVLEEEAALAGATQFYEMLDRERLELARYGAMPKIGVENQPDPKVEAGLLGYRTNHFKTMLKNTRTISLTVDTGHRRLASDFSVAKFIGLGIPIANFHFHGNEGNFDVNTYEDDQHLPPTNDSVTGYDNFCRYFRRFRPTVILELGNFGDYTPSDLKEIIGRVRKDID